MKNYDLDRILLPSFKLFLTNNYDSVSTTKLEDATGLTRGAIYYKLRTKEEIFNAVVNKYILKTHTSIIIADSLSGFIDEYLDRIKNRMEYMLSLGIENMHRAYFRLLYQAIQYYPDFDQKIVAIFNDDLERWKAIIQHAKNKGEIKQSCNVEELAQRFRYTYSGLSFERSLLYGLNVEELRILYYHYYNEIKNEK